MVDQSLYVIELINYKSDKCVLTLQVLQWRGEMTEEYLVVFCKIFDIAKKIVSM